MSPVAFCQDIYHLETYTLPISPGLKENNQRIRPLNQVDANIMSCSTLFTLCAPGSLSLPLMVLSWQHFSISILNIDIYWTPTTANEEGAED